MSLPAESGTTTGRSTASTLLNVLIAVVLLLFIAGGILELIPASYYALTPGQAISVDPMIRVTGFPPVHTKGKLFMTDVSVAQVDHLLEELYWRTRPNVELDPETTVRGNLSAGQYIQLNNQLMNDSIRKAEVAALTVARGYKLHFKQAGPEVVFIVPNSPAVSKLQAGDIIKSINGVRTRDAGQVSPLVKRHSPGSVLHLQILRKGRPESIAVRTVASTNGVPTKHGKTPLVGVYVEDQIALPIQIQIQPGDIGGPSAGLVFSLGLIERLQRRDITKGCRVAGTGTIDFSGAVGPIGGAQQKVVAAENAGASYFLVPASGGNARDAKKAANHIAVIPVKSLRQALNFLNLLKPCR